MQAKQQVFISGLSPYKIDQFRLAEGEKFDNLLKARVKHNEFEGGFWMVRGKETHIKAYLIPT